MKIYKVQADSRPANCLVCPIKLITKGSCGQHVTREQPGGWKTQGMYPDTRCKFEIVEVEK